MRNEPELIRNERIGHQKGIFIFKPLVEVVLHVELVLDVVLLAIEQRPKRLDALAVFVEHTTLGDLRRVGTGE